MTFGPLLLARASSVTVNFNNLAHPSTSIVIIVALTVLAVAPAALLLLTPFTEVFVTLKIVSNALGIQGVPPSQVLAALSLFISLALVAPVLTHVDHSALQPWLAGKMSFSKALVAAEGPFRTYMLHHTRKTDLDLFLSAAGHKGIALSSAPIVAVIPAYTISSIETAMLMGFLVYVPFVVIDLVVSSILMSTGIVMLPPTLISLPFKILLFVLVDGWALVASALLKVG
jgi:flagellar biosynthetic protein FliP